LRGKNNSARKIPVSMPLAQHHQFVINGLEFRPRFPRRQTGSKLLVQFVSFPLSRHATSIFMKAVNIKNVKSFQCRLWRRMPSRSL